MSTFQFIGLGAAAILCTWGLLSLMRGVLRRVIDPQNAAGYAGGLVPLAIGVMVFLVVWYGFAFMEPPVLFLHALRDGDDRRAFSMLTESAQTDVGGYEGFQEWADVVRPKSWFMGSSCSIPGEGRSDGSVRLMSDEHSYISFHVIREDQEWQVAGIHFWDLDPTYWVGSSSGLDCSD
ncbi:MAG: hypothetical protein JXA33_10385 [Anaerolineae bacterium]|nr:hypothetical protein [Anaerolineae bacterium]